MKTLMGALLGVALIVGMAAFAKFAVPRLYSGRVCVSWNEVQVPNCDGPVTMKSGDKEIVADKVCVGTRPERVCSTEAFALLPHKVRP